MLKKRLALCRALCGGFKHTPGIRVPYVLEKMQQAWHLYVIQLELNKLRIGRNESIDLLTKYNIGSNVHFIPLHFHPHFHRTFGYLPGDFPIASAMFERIVSLPI